ncbi:MAG: dihydroxyacetone kinase [Lachnospiraceae bacterium]|nr:dihydroxyacetone kinase [Lachnospiraceae bacterium]
MTGFVLVSHSRMLAEGARELGLMMAPEVPVEAAGGMADGGIGTDYGRISEAIEKVAPKAGDGILVIVDMGSACMTTEMVLEDRGDMLPRAVMVDCPFAEGTVAGMVSASMGLEFEEVIEAAKEACSVNKF